MVEALKWVRKLHMLYFNLYASRLCSSLKNVLGMKKSIGFILRSLSPLVYTQQKSTLMIYAHYKNKIQISVILCNKSNSLNLMSVLDYLRYSNCFLWIEWNYASIIAFKCTTELIFTVGSFWNTKKEEVKPFTLFVV